ncbi:MAG TPA: ATP/GTP-binding protein [Ohtaekwangia sp.]
MKPIRAILSFLLLLITFSGFAQSPQLTKLWETDSTLKVPESVLYYAPEKILFVSCIDGKPDEKDLKGSISKVNLDGKILKANWAVNLSAPKGMGIAKDQLYVADLSEVVAIDLKSGKISRRIPVAGSIFLNDITIDDKGVVYVSDSRTGKVHRIQGSNVTTYLENKMGVNGLLAVGDDLYLTVKDTLYRSDKNKKLTPITTGMDQSSDGIIRIGNDFIVSCWNGIIYLVKADGNKIELLDTRPAGSNTADIGYDPSTQTLYVPTFLKNRVVAYQIKR